MAPSVHSVTVPRDCQFAGGLGKGLAATPGDGGRERAGETQGCCTGGIQQRSRRRDRAAWGQLGGVHAAWALVQKEKDENELLK